MEVGLIKAGQEKFFVNTRKILFLNNTKDGPCLVMEDGKVYKLGMTYGEVMAALRRSARESK